MNPLLLTFGDRLVELNNRDVGLRTGLGIEVRVADGTEDELLMIASDETVDRYNEVIKLEGWDLDEYRRNPVVLDSHDSSSVSRIIGRSTRVECQDNALVNQVRFCRDNPLGDLAYKMARGGFIRAESVGFIPLEWIDSKSPYRTYTKQKLVEISLVAVPANPGATVGAALSKGVITPRDVRSVIETLTPFATEPNPEAQARPNGPEVDVGQLRELLDRLQRVL